MLRRTHHDREVGLVGGELMQQFLAVVHGQVEHHTRIAARELGQQPGKEVIACADHCDIQLAPGDALQLTHRFIHFVELLDDRAAVVKHFGAGRRQVDFLAELFEERQPCMLLELTHLSGNGRLRQMQFLGCTRETQVARHRLEDLQLPQCRVSHRHGRCISDCEST